MITQLLYIRHGQSEANEAGVYAGQNPHIQLTQQGRAQALAAGHALAGSEIDHIIASDLDRAYATAVIIAQAIGYDIDAISRDVRLRELNVGSLMGKPDRGFLGYMELAASGQDPQMETPAQIAARLTSFINDLASSQGRLLVVAHAGVARVMKSLLEAVPLSELAATSIPNAMVFELPIAKIGTL